MGKVGNALGMAFVVILIATASWQLYSMVNSGSTKLLEFLGVTNEFLQGGILIGVVVLLLVLLGVTTPLGKVIGVKK